MSTLVRKTKIAAALSFALLFAAGSASAATIDLNTWQQEGHLSNGNWNVAADGSSVLQTTNGQPTFFVSPNDFINTTFEGQFAVETTSDNDFIGFVFGYNSPLSDNGDPTNEYDMLLFDWKQSEQSFGGHVAEPGFTLSKVDGVSLDTEDTFWGHASSAVNVIDSDYGAQLGWEDNTTYQFTLLYQENRIKIDIAGGAFGSGTTIFDVMGVFSTGRFGFYNYSQSSVRYQGFTEEVTPPDVDDGPTTEIPEPATGLLLGGAIVGLASRRRLRRA